MKTLKHQVDDTERVGFLSSLAVSWKQESFQVVKPIHFERFTKETYRVVEFSRVKNNNASS